MALYKDIISVVFTDTEDNEYAIDQVVAIQVGRGGSRIQHAADDDRHITYVDMVDHTSTVTVFTKDFILAVGEEGAAGVAIPRGTAGSLTFVVKTADGGANKTFTFGDNVNTFCRFMGGGGNPKHASIESDGTLKFRGYCPDGDTAPLVVS